MPDSWTHLRQLTNARIALGRSGGSLPTRALLDFRLAHAHARDAVQSPFSDELLRTALAPTGLPVLSLNSAAPDLQTYLRRPDLGRRLDEPSRESILSHAAMAKPHDLAIILSNGLSAQAVHENAAPLVHALVDRLTAARWSLAPLVVVKNARVALSDEVGHLLHARIALILLGERPGLGGGDSLGAYFTFDPVPGKNDADRNCVSNIRAGGLVPEQAAAKLASLMLRSRSLGLSGVQLKDEESMLGSDPVPVLPVHNPTTL
ncbi:MAG: ethanolamine ammonia-lyase subunit EutC [Candidatus Methylacidiphilales bacterium]|nr:ethanolamine ammonia-lyase subunit EutC [Candidatus Methylacidiphilales bacterium]